VCVYGVLNVVLSIVVTEQCDKCAISCPLSNITDLNVVVSFDLKSVSCVTLNVKQC